MRSSVLAAQLALVLAVLVPRVAAAGGPVKVAVVPGIAVGVDAARVDALGQDLAAALAQELDVEATGGLEVRRKLPPDGLPADCVAQAACVADVAKRVGAAQLLFIVVVDTGADGAVQIDSTWLDPAAGASASRPAIDLASGAEPRSRFAAAARGLLPDAPARPAPAQGIGGAMTPVVPRHYTTPAKLTTGVAVVGLGVGIGFGLAARSKYRACDVEPAAPLGCDEQHGAIRPRALIADLGYAVAVGGAIATAVLIATSGKESRLVVAPAPGGVAVTAAGRF